MIKELKNFNILPVRNLKLLIFYHHFSKRPTLKKYLNVQLNYIFSLKIFHLNLDGFCSHINIKQVCFQEVCMYLLPREETKIMVLKNSH